MKHVTEMVKELIETGKTHTIIRWGRWSSYYEKDYTDEVIKAIGGGDYHLGKTLVTIGNDAPRGGILGTFVALDSKGFEKLWLTIKAPICKRNGKDLLGTIQIAYDSFLPTLEGDGRIHYRKGRVTKTENLVIPEENLDLTEKEARNIYKDFIAKGAQIHVYQNAVVD